MHCKGCGKEIADNSLFCKYCGCKVSDSVKVTLEPQEQNNVINTDIAGITYGNVSNASTISGEVKFGAERGHGFAAERVNHLHDKLTGKDALLVGDDNIKMVPKISILLRKSRKTLVKSTEAAKKIGEENEYTEKSFKMVEEIDRIYEEKENLCGN